MYVNVAMCRLKAAYLIVCLSNIFLVYSANMGANAKSAANFICDLRSRRQRALVELWLLPDLNMRLNGLVKFFNELQCHAQQSLIN